MTPTHILDVTHGVIIHQVNCQNKFDYGLSEEIKQKYPIVAKQYAQTCLKYANDKSALLGKYQPIVVSDDLCIVLSYSQFYYGNAEKSHQKYTDENALITNIQTVCSLCPDLDIYVPDQIGAGLSGGDWKTIYDNIHTIKNLTIV